MFDPLPSVSWTPPGLQTGIFSTQELNLPGLKRSTISNTVSAFLALSQFGPLAVRYPSATLIADSQKRVICYVIFPEIEPTTF